MASRSRSPSRERVRSRTRSPTPSDYSQSSERRRRYDSRCITRSPTSPLRRNGRPRSPSRSRSRSRGRGRDSRDGSLSPPPKSTKVVVERLSKNVNEQHLSEIFGQFGPIKDLDLPINRSLGTNRGTAYILYEYEADAEAAIAHMHEAQLDGAAINVSIVLQRRKLSPAPPVAKRGANIDPRVPFSGRGGAGGSGFGGGMNQGGGGGGGRRRGSPSGRFAPRSDVYRPGSRSPSRSPGGPPREGGSGRYRSRSKASYSSRSRSRSRSPLRRRGGGGGGGGGGGRSDSRDSHSSHGDRSPSRSRNRRYR